MKRLEAEAAKLTPWELRDGLWIKRDDLFSPAWPGGPNGSKLRQLVHLFSYRGNATHVVTGASALSPQHCMTAYLAHVCGLPITHVVAVKDVTKYPSTAIAAYLGAKFHYVKVGYNPVLQRAVRTLTLPDSFVVPYGITTEDPERIRSFHAVGAAQVRNIPTEVERLYVPAGSCNTLCSIMVGLCNYPSHVRELISIGIGPSRVDWLQKRLRSLGIDSRAYPFHWDHSISLHESGYASYGDKMKEKLGGIDMHPTYEGHVVRYLKENVGLPNDGKTGFWVVGGAPCLPG